MTVKDTLPSTLVGVTPTTSAMSNRRPHSAASWSSIKIATKLPFWMSLVGSKARAARPLGNAAACPNNSGTSPRVGPKSLCEGDSTPLSQWSKDM